ncbi:hypothetical protein B0H13DRAFT_2308239 [Mycena leptocephala]|nr:hypothetical protein B0H13DRAFT_2308239 [Mycena leptocephala]
MSSVTLRRCSGSSKSKSLYDTIVEEAEAQRDSHLASHALDQTFFRSRPDYRGDINLQKADATPFIANFIAEIGTQEQPMNDATLKSYRKVLALRCPSQSPPALRKLFRNGVAVRTASDLRMRRRRLQRADWDVVESILCDKGEGDITDRIIMLARLHPTFKIQYGNSDSAIVQAPRRRITKIEDDDAEAPSDVSMEDSSSAERKIGDLYPPERLPEVRGPFYALERSQLRQHDYRNSDGTLISPPKIKSVLTPGTLVLVMLKLILYVMRDQKTEKGEPKPNKKASLSYSPVPTVPAIGDHHFSPSTPTKKARDDAADAAFDSFGSGASPSPSKRAKRSGPT